MLKNRSVHRSIHSLPPIPRNCHGNMSHRFRSTTFTTLGGNYGGKRNNIITVLAYKTGNFPLYQNFLIDRPFYTLRLLQFRIFALEFGLLPPFLTTLIVPTSLATVTLQPTNPALSPPKFPSTSPLPLTSVTRYFPFLASRSQWIICRIISRMKGAKIHGKTSFKKWRYAFRHKGWPLCWKDKEH